MSLFDDISNIPTRSSTRNVGSPSEVEFVHSQGDIVRVIPIPELPKIDFDLATEYEQAPVLATPIRASVTVTGLPIGYVRVNAAFTIACGGGFVSTVNAKCQLVEQGGDASAGDNAMVLPGEASLVMPQPIYVPKERSFYAAKPEIASNSLTFKYSKISLPSGCPYDVAVVVKGSATDPDAPSTESYLAAVKYEECPSKSGTIKYSTIYVKDSESGFYCFEDSRKTWLQGITKPTESSLWGFSPEENFQFRIKSDLYKSDIQVWANIGKGCTSSMWATESQAGLKLEDDEGNSSFLDTGNIWLKFDGGADYTHGYPGYFRLQFESGEYSNLYAGGLYINDSENWVQIDPPGQNAYFQRVFLGDMSRRWVLCSDESSETLTCADLPDPLVRNVRAKRVESHIPPFDLCGATGTYLDLANPFLQIAALGAATKVTIEPDTIWVSDPDQSLSVEPHAINIVSSAGSSEFSDTYLHVSRNTGAYASFDGAGWLEMKNSAGKVIYLDPTKIEFTNGAKVATHDADGYTAINGSSNFAYYRADVANLVTSSNEGEFRADRLTISQTSGNVSAQLTVNSGSGTLSVENSNGGKGIYQATFAKLEDSLGDSTLTTQSLHLNGSSGSYATFNGAGWLELKNSAGRVIYLDPTEIVFTNGSITSTHNANGLTSTSGGAYATIDGAGWLELKNAAGKVIYLDPTEIVFTDSGKTSTHNADGFTASEGSDSGNLNSEELWMTMGGVGVAKVSGSEIRISKENGGICVIDPPENKSCSFRKAKVCVNGQEKTAYILMSEPEDE